MGEYRAYHTVKKIGEAIEESINSNNQAPVLICNSHITGLAVARSLGRKGVPILALDREEKGLAFASKYVSVRGVCPNPVDDEEGFIAFLLEIGPFFSKKCILFPCMDEWALVLAKHADVLSDYYVWHFSNYEIINQVLDKSQLYKTADRLDVPVPLYQAIDRENPSATSGSLSFPLVLKPIEKRAFYDRFQEALFIAKNEKEYLHQVNLASDLALVAQEQIPSSKGCYVTVVVYMDKHHEVRGSLVGKRLEIYPPENGTTCLVESIEQPELVQQAVKVLDSFGYQGIAECEFMYDPRDQVYKLLDINTRPWKWIGLPIHCGVDLPYLLYRDAINEPLTSKVGKTGVKWVYVQDYMSLKESGKGIFSGDILSKEEWLDLLSGKIDSSERITAAVESADDPEPVYQMIKNKFSKGKYYCPC